MENVALVDILDNVLNRGAVVLGECTVSLGEVDLIYLELQLVLSSVETLRQAHTWKVREPVRLEAGAPSRGTSPGLERETPEQGSGSSPISDPWPPVPSPQSRNRGEDGPERSLVQLVMTLIELLRQLVERQAIRRTTGGGLSDRQVEQLGLSLMELEAKMVELRDMFGLKEDDIQIDLGPLGRLL